MSSESDRRNFDPFRKASRLPPLAPPLEPTVAALFEDSLSRGGHILNLHLTNAHAPRLAKPRRAFTTALRNDCLCPRLDREIAICRAAQIVGCDYEWVQHRPFVIRAGLSEDQADALADWTRHRDLFNPRQIALMTYVDQLCGERGRVTDAVFADMQRHYSPQEIVELTTCATNYYATGLYMKALGLLPDAPHVKTAPGVF